MPNQSSEYLKNNIERIMCIWQERVQRELKEVPDQELLLLRNSLPEYLFKLAENLAYPPEEKPNAIIGKKHGLARAKTPNYTIDQLISEYHILRQTIFQVMEESHVLSAFHREVIINSVEQSVNDAATEFSDYLKEIQETLSRTLVHDLRSPLSIAKLCLRLIRSAPENTLYNETVKAKISTSLDRIDSMIYHLLDASIIKAGQKLPLQIEKVDLSGLIQKIAGEFNFAGTDRFLIQTPLTIIGFWDPSGLTRILENLATNALKYGDPDTPISISAESKSGYVKIAVHNVGKEISREDQLLIFQPFRRTKSAENKPGWGLGLTVVKSIAEAHGGEVQIESSKETGTSFTVHLPIDCRPDNS